VRRVMTMCMRVPSGLPSLFVVLLVSSCGHEAQTRAATVPGHEEPLDGADVERDLALADDDDEAATERDREANVHEPAEQIVFDAGDASEVPAEGVVAQPQREPSPSLMGGIGYSPR
jgi:hypothetical protein